MAVRPRPILKFVLVVAGSTIAGFLAVLIGGFLYLVVHAALHRDELRRRETLATVRKTASAAEMFLSENRRCPTISDLREAKILSPKVRVLDAWDNELRITCDEREVHVRSPGPDHRLGTTDDVGNNDKFPSPRPGG